ncbi:hypothetical protein FGO68_gene15010 [Halteria grandinella]|uniref:Uncharacterized protein n=1 Tax=Halteria grandinella TaxID=5974 RepID=A0A8J8NH51_HALGN|nr:hypothetical protein FGO68_gene15010 [Halteria grandinella]
MLFVKLMLLSNLFKEIKIHPCPFRRPKILHCILCPFFVFLMHPLIKQELEIFQLEFIQVLIQCTFYPYLKNHF